MPNLTTLLAGMPLDAAVNTGLPVAPGTPTPTIPGGGANARLTFGSAHGLVEGQRITITGVTGATGLNSTWAVTVISPTVVDLIGSSAVTGTPAGTAVVTIPTVPISAIVNPRIDLTLIGNGQAAIEDSVDGTNWVTRWTRAFAGTNQVSLQQGDFLTHERFGTSNAVLRVRCISGAFSHVAVFVGEA